MSENSKNEHVRRNLHLAKQLEKHKKFLHRSLNKKIPLAEKANILESFYGILNIQEAALALAERLSADGASSHAR